MDSRQLWFKTDKFEILPGEDAETNPLCFGRELAEWLRIKLISKGYSDESVIPEDWGWCVMCSRKPIELFVGCVNVHDYATSKPTDPIPKGRDVIWACTVFATQSFFNGLFKSADTKQALEHLFEHVHSTLAEEPNVIFVEQP